MKDKFDTNKESRMKRREFLSSAAIPVVAALAPPSLFAQGSQSVASRAEGRVRVGIIGAGTVVREVMIPGFKKIQDCEVVAVANRSLQSSQRVADEFDIPRAYSSWQELLDDDGVDAVLIGTWPYMHHTITLAALESGKHVLCQARMSNTAAEAHEMLAASRQHPDLICQLVPTSTSYVVDRAVQRLLKEAYVGEVLSVEIQRVQRSFADINGELHWRHDREFSGYNVLNIGSTYESMMRWFSAGNRVMAMTKVHVPQRRNPDGELQPVSIPDHVDVLYELDNGAQVHMKFSSTSGLSSGNQTWIFGSEGTIHIAGTPGRVDGGQSIFVGRRGDTQLAELSNPREEQASYRVEEEFINAILGVEEVTMETFDTGAKYMEWTEAVYRSSESGAAVDLPLTI
jgi:predicted dehydrogenase